MSNELSEKEAAALFNQVTENLRENDPIKLAEVMEVKATSEEVVPAEEDKSKETSTDNTSEETSTEQEGGEEAPGTEKKEDDKKEVDPLKEADQTVSKEDTKQEPSDLDKLKEQIEKLSKENHGLRSQVGRLPHVQRRIKELDKKLEELSNQEASPSSHPSAKIAPRVQELLKGISETDSDLADAIAKAIVEATKGVTDEARAKEKETLTFLRQQEVKTFQDVQAERLLDMYPNAPEVFASKAWNEWKASQPAWLGRLADSDDADEVSEALQRYSAAMYEKYPELREKTEHKKEESTSVVSAEDAEKAKRVEAERARKKETSVNITNPTAAGKVNLPDDPLALFNKFSEEIRKQRMG